MGRIDKNIIIDIMFKLHTNGYVYYVSHIIYKKIQKCFLYHMKTNYKMLQRYNFYFIFCGSFILCYTR